MNESNELPSPRDVKGKYRSKLGELKQIQEELGLESPDMALDIDAGIAKPEEGRPAGGILPAYELCDEDTPEERARKSEFNIISLTGYNPGKKKK